MRANHDPAHVLGLCHQWQRVTWEAASPAAGSVGWVAAAVSQNAGDDDEHHAVVVFDPKMVHMQDLTATPPPRLAWVLDPWITGTPEAYAWDDWSGYARGLPIRIRVTPEP